MRVMEDGDPKVKAVLKRIYPQSGKAHVIGVTGAAGTGKSSLIDRMTAEYRRRKKTGGILAVDPSSVFSMGAILGDRVRMREHFVDDWVFIRSFATRGSHGGVSAAVREAIHLLDAAGKEVIFVETIGVGQELLCMLREKVFAELTKKIADDSLETQVKLIAERQIDPYSAVDQMAKRIGI